MSVQDSGLETGISRYGALCSDLPAAVAVLRAKASAHGMHLKDVAPVDMAAAALGADAWMLVLRTSTFELPLSHGEGAVRALAAILARAAGSRVECQEVESEKCATDPVLIFAAESHARWAQAVVGPEAPTALRRAAGDLSAAGVHSALTHYSELLLIVADKLEMPRIFA